MKIVQTSWACNQKDMLKFNAGWYSPEYHLMGWALSCLQLKKYYDEVVLHADSVTAKTLIDTLRLPYTDVVCDLDQFDQNPSELWGLPKIHTYSQQAVPFLHVDGDVIIWKPFDESLLHGDLIAQNLEVGTSFYENLFSELEPRLTYIPIEVTEEKDKKDKIYAYNAGIIGGNDLSFFNLYTARSKETISNNVNSLSNINIGAFNIYFEQYLFYCLAAKFNKKVNVLFDEIIPDNQYKSFGDFTEVPFNKNYLHLIGQYKRTSNVCQQLANRLRQDYPEYYYRIIALFKNQQTPLKKDYYYFINQPTEKYLTDRYFNLKDCQQHPDWVISEKNTGIKSETKRQFQSKIVENVLAAIDNTETNNIDDAIYSKMLNDAKLFEARLNDTIENDFSQHSNEFLYQRDIAHTNYFEYIFADRDSSYAKKIVADKIVQITESSFDWRSFDTEISKNLKKRPLNLNETPTSVYVCIIPECHYKGYSLSIIDDLDMRLLQISEQPVAINDVLTEIRSVFEPDDLKASLAEFELLIIGRIKLMLQAKIIKAVK
ncbi:DUF6734 family protein [Mucilaginibacter sp. Mucisp84]|uniref:DUF6734 family protein n=1 Tax=Mucilaginibacter sp. Mucisp84 TaxID=3243058 RepID=UPI0039A5ABFC